MILANARIIPHFQGVIVLLKLPAHTRTSCRKQVDSNC